MANPNFPANLKIEPSVATKSIAKDAFDDSWSFDASEQRKAISKYGIAGRVWESAYVLLAYLKPPSDWIFDPSFDSMLASSKSPRCFIELGSGSGAISHYLSTLLDESKDLLVVTDLPEVCPLLEENLGLSSSNVLIRPLSWGNSTESDRIRLELEDRGSMLTYIICSDLVYFPELLAPLLRTLIQLTSPPFTSIESFGQQAVIISYKIRSLAKESLFWSAFGLWFSFYPVLYQRGSSAWIRTGTDEDVPFVFVAHRRPNSLSWKVPSGDVDLLHGVGAYGTTTRKSDDTFESMLLMSVDVTEDDD
ncbi:hypothetical protein ONZ45_g10867 [Pleurotus djamor]|nr:hypothetical protein ONZ45_g10867 [Pleurotus djamor]